MRKAPAAFEARPHDQAQAAAKSEDKDKAIAEQAVRLLEQLNSKRLIQILSNVPEPIAF